MPTTYNCPVLGCPWTHTDPGPQSLADDASPDDVQAEAVLHGATVEHAIRAHYETHDTEAWALTVNALHQELAARSAPLVCVGCLSDRWQAEQFADRTAPLPPISPAVTVVDGNASCRRHLQFGAPQIPGRTAAGIILGDGPMPGKGI